MSVVLITVASISTVYRKHLYLTIEPEIKICSEKMSYTNRDTEETRAKCHDN